MHVIQIARAEAQAAVLAVYKHSQRHTGSAPLVPGLILKCDTGTSENGHAAFTIKYKSGVELS